MIVIKGRRLIDILSSSVLSIGVVCILFSIIAIKSLE